MKTIYNDGGSPKARPSLLQQTHTQTHAHAHTQTHAILGSFVMKSLLFVPLNTFTAYQNPANESMEYGVT